MIHAVHRMFGGLLWPLVVALCAPAIVVASAGILLSLLVIFVVWLLIVAALVSTIVLTDLVRGSMRYLALAPVWLERRAIGVSGR